MSWVDGAIGAGGVAGVVAVLAPLGRHLLVNMAKAAVEEGVKEMRDDLQNLVIKFAAETGGNSNGLRQKLNEVSGDVNDVATGVAELRGAFNQHVQQHGAPTVVNVGHAAPLPPPTS